MVAGILGLLGWDTWLTKEAKVIPYKLSVWLLLGTSTNWLGILCHWWNTEGL